MNILLLSPKFPDTFWSFRHALPFVGRRAPHPPLGLLTVAALLPSQWNMRLVDLNVTDLTDADLAWADCAFIGGMVVQRESARDAIERCKTAGLTVVAGGPLFTMEYTDFPLVDHFVLNEGEVSLPPFLVDFAHGRARRVYRAAEYADMATSPVPRWDLLDLGQYAAMSVQFCRGCPYDCEFCNVTALLGHRPRIKSAAQIVTELDALYADGWRGPVFFVDDNLIGNKRYLKNELLPALVEWQRGKTGIMFNSQVSMNVADDPELLDLMSLAGFDAVFIGIETPDETALTGCNKKQNLRRDLARDVRKVQRAGIEIHAGFIVGFDTDTSASFGRLADFIQHTGIATAMVGMLQAPAGTRLHERMEREGRLLGTMTGDNVDGTTNIMPLMGLDQLRRQYRDLIRYLYEPPQYYDRVRTFLREFRAPRMQTPLDVDRLMAFVRSIIRLGILGRERFHYWRLLGWTLMHRPRVFPRAVSLAIYGYHFRLIAERRIG